VRLAAAAGVVDSEAEVEKEEKEEDDELEEREQEEEDGKIQRQRAHQQLSHFINIFRNCRIVETPYQIDSLRQASLSKLQWNLQITTIPK
jgi:hypothetical protein